MSGRGTGIPCRFWQSGVCNKGSNCSFAHVGPAGGGGGAFGGGGGFPSTSGHGNGMFQGGGGRGGTEAAGPFGGAGRGGYQGNNFDPNYAGGGRGRGRGRGGGRGSAPPQHQQTYFQGQPPAPQHFGGGAGAPPPGGHFGSGQGGDSHMGGGGRQGRGGRRSSGGGRGGGGGRGPSGGSLQQSNFQVCLEYCRTGSCKFSGKCKYAHSFTPDGTVSKLAEISCHEGAVRAMVLRADQGEFYSAGQDGVVNVWDLGSGQNKGSVSCGVDIASMIFESGFLIVGLRSGAIRIWNMGGGGAEQTLEGHSKAASCLGVSRQGFLISGGYDGVIKVWKYDEVSSQFAEAGALAGHNGAEVECLHVAEDEAHVFSGSWDHTIKMWSLNTGACVLTLRGHQNVVTHLLEYQGYLVSASVDDTLRVWEAPKFQSDACKYTHPTLNSGGIRSVVLVGGEAGAEGACLAVAYNNATMVLLALPLFGSLGVVPLFQEAYRMIAGPDNMVFTGDGDGNVKVWKVGA